MIDLKNVEVLYDDGWLSIYIGDNDDKPRIAIKWIDDKNNQTLIVMPDFLALPILHGLLENQIKTVTSPDTNITVHKIIDAMKDFVE